MPAFNWGQSILQALANAVGLILAFIPRLIGFLVILLVGWLISWAVQAAVTGILRRVGFDRLSERTGFSRLSQNMGIRMDAAGLLGKIVYWFLFLIFLVAAADALGIAAISNVLNMIVGYLPNVFAAVLVLFVGALVGNLAGDLVRRLTTRMGNSAFLGNLVRWGVLGFAALIALEQLDIAPALMNILFAAVAGGLAIAFGLAFGLGGQDTARRLLSRGEGVVAGGSATAEQLQTEQLRARQMQAEQTRAEPMGSYQPQYGEKPGEGTRQPPRRQV
jgi:small-conductance mechanosensitive channel